MNLNEYQELASRTANDGIVFKANLCHYAMGCAGEGGEVNDYIKKVAFQGHEYKREKVANELGDILWYVSQLARVTGYTLEEIVQMNVEKLKKRYPQGFKSEDSVKRVDVNG